jgi:hypothetical protein
MHVCMRALASYGEQNRRMRINLLVSVDFGRCFTRPIRPISHVITVGWGRNGTKSTQGWFSSKDSIFERE